MAATFRSLRETRLPKALKAIGLLANLSRYAHTEDEAKELVNALLDAADKADAAFAKQWGWGSDTPAPDQDPRAVPGWAAEKGGAPWAHVRDMAQAAPLSDLQIAMAVYLNRLQEEVFDARQQ